MDSVNNRLFTRVNRAIRPWKIRRRARGKSCVETGCFPPPLCGGMEVVGENRGTAPALDTGFPHQKHRLCRGCMTQLSIETLLDVVYGCANVGVEVNLLADLFYGVDCCGVVFPAELVSDFGKTEVQFAPE